MAHEMERPLTSHIRHGEEPLDRAGYERVGGYRALRKALGSMTPADLQGLVKDADLRGRGGGGFPAGVKWGLVPIGPDAPHPKYLVANADEMEPGTFKDRYLMEGAPHQLIEGMVLASYAIGADVAYLFLRWEYRLAARRLTRAIAEAYDAGLLGQDILGSGYGLELRLHVSAGRYICGEETSMLSSLEGKRAIPRAKPPYPQISGLWGLPTVVNNVETLACLPHIVEHGSAWFRGLGRGAAAGTKLYAATGNVTRPGVWELPLGSTLREVLEEHAGGMLPGFRFRGALPGGASTDFLVEQHLDLPLDFDSLAQAKSRLGTGTAVILDHRTCPVGMVLNLERFFARESCGWCTPCRDGLPWVARLLDALERGRGERGDLERLEEHCVLLGPGKTFCALAPGAVEPLQSALRWFADDFEKHLTRPGCPWRKT